MWCLIVAWGCLLVFECGGVQVGLLFAVVLIVLLLLVCLHWLYVCLRLWLVWFLVGGLVIVLLSTCGLWFLVYVGLGCWVYSWFGLGWLLLCYLLFGCCAALVCLLGFGCLWCFDVGCGLVLTYVAWL